MTNTHNIYTLSVEPIDLRFIVCFVVYEFTCRLNTFTHGLCLIRQNDTNLLAIDLQIKCMHVNCNFKHFKFLDFSIYIYIKHANHVNKSILEIKAFVKMTHDITMAIFSSEINFPFSVSMIRFTIRRISI